MEKQKLPPGPKPRIKRALPPPGDFIALGKSSTSKPRSNNETDNKPSQPVIRKPAIGPSAHAATGQKRKDLSPVNPASTKQARTFSPSFNRNKEKTLDVSQTLPSVKLVDAQPAELEEAVLAASAKNDLDQVEGLLCGAIKTLKVNRLKPDPMIYLTMVNLAKAHPVLFSSKRVTEHLLQFLRRENILTAVKPKPNTLLGIMTCNILLHAYQNEDSWPQSFMKVYVEDALGDRSWVDNENNKDFVANITSIFSTVLPSKNTSAANTSNKGSLDTTVIQMDTGNSIKAEEERIMEEVGIYLEVEEPLLVRNRYAMHKDEIAVQTYIHEVVKEKEQLNKRQMIDSVSRNTLRFLTAVCGYVDIRLLASQKIETWLQNPKLTRPTQELLMSVVLNCNTHSADDIEVIANLVKMRLKAKPVSNHYINCMKELVNQHPDNLCTTLKRVIHNELSQQRNPNNMAVLSAMFTSNQENSAKHLSSVFQDLLCNREDYLRAIRALLREIVRFLKYEINLVEFCRGLMQDKREQSFSELEQQHKERMLASVIDLINLGCLLCVSPAVKELNNALAKGEKRDYSVLQAFQTQISTIQRDAIWFFHTKVKVMYNVSEKDFITGLNRTLFLEAGDYYSQRDNWPPEAERSNLIQLVTEVPLTEDGLLRLHLLGLSDESPMNCADTLDIVERMIHRSAVLTSGLPGLEIERTEVMNMLLSLSAYSHPKEISLPTSYIPPTLAIKTLYWKSWLNLLILAATNPSTIGIKVWELYPTARCMMEMLITGCYEFPPFAVDGIPPDDVKSNELQIGRAEKDDIVVFEGHLAAATSGALITESNSLLISQLINLDPSGPARQPPDFIMEKLKVLNEKYKLGKLLCQCREPDFLLSIIQNQGSSKSMPWLADLVQSSEGSLNALPLQCLCEFLLMKHQTDSSGNHQSRHRSIKSKVAGRLQDLLLGTEATPQSSSDLIQYFINRWSSPELKDREASVYGFKTIILHQKKHRATEEESPVVIDQDVKMTKKQAKRYLEDVDSYLWLHEKLLTFPFIDNVVMQLLTSMRQALHVEMNANRIQAYIFFLNKHYENQDVEFLDVLMADLSCLITKRSTVINTVVDPTSENGRKIYECLLSLFTLYAKRKLETSDKEINGDDLVSVMWKEGKMKSKKTILTPEMMQASIILLTFGKMLGTENVEYNFLLSTWLPFSSYEIKDIDRKKIHLIELWIKLLMVQSGIETLVQEALKDLKSLDLISFLKSSGINIKTKNIILKHLDTASITEPKIILNCTPDKEYILKMVDLSKAQGAEYGVSFSKLLKSDGMVITMEEGSPKEITSDLAVLSFGDKKIKVKLEPSPSGTYTNAEVGKILKDKFQSNSNSSTNKSFILLKQKLSKENIMCKNGSHSPIANQITDFLLSYCKQKSFQESFSSNKESCILIRILSFSNERKTEGFLGLLTLLHNSKVNKSVDLEKTVKHLCHANGINQKKASSEQTIQVLMQDILKQKLKQDPQKVKEFLIKLKSSQYEKVPKGNLIKVALHIHQYDRSMFEEFIKVLCCNTKNQHNDKFCIEVLAEVIKSTGNGASGIIIDWLSLLDPEILQLHPILLRELLFTENKPESTKEVEGESTKDSSQSALSYLVSVLAHESRNSTLQDCVQWILGSSRLLSSFNASGCLDFLTTMIYNPRLWQGRESKQNDSAKESYQDSDIMATEHSFTLDLSFQQTYNLIHLILMELSSVINIEKSKTTSTKVILLMEKRLSLLLNLSQNIIHLQKAVNMTRQIKKFPNEVIQCFVQYFYMKRPTLCNLSKEYSTSESFQILPVDNKMEMDLVIHRLILSISAPDSSNEWEEKFNSISAIHRRLAVQHPFAFIRQLPLLLSLMKGKNRLSVNIFKWTNQLKLCIHVFNLFDLLRPHIFASDQNSKDIMDVFIDVFLELIHAPCLNNDDGTAFVSKLAEFLTHYIASGNKDSGILLKKHEGTFRDLLYDFPNFEDLTTIVTYIAAFDEEANSQSSLVSATPSPWSDVQLKSFRKRLSTNHHDRDLLTVIHDLNDASKRKVNILQHFLDELSLLISSNNQEIRDRTHKLLLKYYKHNPRNATNLIDLYMGCLSSDNPDVVDSAAKYSPQGLLLCDEKSDVLMKHMYAITVTSRAHLDNYIKDAIKNLNADYDT